MTIQKKDNATDEVVVYKIYIIVYLFAEEGLHIISDNSSIYAQGNGSKLRHCNLLICGGVTHGEQQ
jgi:hypothetical protein